MSPALAEVGIKPSSYETARTLITQGLEAGTVVDMFTGAEDDETRYQRPRLEVSSEQPNAISEKESPYGFPVRFSVGAGQSMSSPDVLHVLDIQSTPAHTDTEEARAVDRLRLLNPDVQFLLVGRNLTVNGKEPTGFKAVRVGEPITLGVGEGTVGSRFDFSNLVSRSQAVLLLEKHGSFRIRDLGSTNGTSVKAGNTPAKREEISVEELPQQPAESPKERPLGRLAVSGVAAVGRLLTKGSEARAANARDADRARQDEYRNRHDRS